MFKSKYSGYRADGVRVLPWGGDKSQDTTATTNTTDSRQVNTTTTTSYDLSARDSNNQTNSNNTSAVFNTTNTTTDGGAIAGMASVALAAGSNALDQIKAAMGLASSVVTGSNAATVNAYGYADGIFHASLDAMQANDTKAYDAWDRAATMEESALTATSAASASALSTLQNAYADAKGTTQASQQMMMALAAVAALAVLSRRA